ncbi:MAG: cysteine--tRNA ligase [Rubrimonas sp.]|uniref:cysteine--tRNA ligase n=1 Tax=Rubrimonas sp. TaxID=2036015 RepID=UPI002FDD59B5
MTTIRLHDSLRREKRDFAPIDPKNVRMYVCGPTVYDRAHIGNARPVVVFDVLFRLLRHVYGADHVTYVRNITDVEDKIIARAAERGVSIDALTAETARWFEEDMDALGCLKPTHEPRATGHIPGMIAMIEVLIAQGCAYEAEGHVLFEVAKYPAYGALSGRSTDDMIAGARVEVAPYKRDPMDFVLWKPSTPDQPGWDSPWGRGRPGWHIECSAMAKALLGPEFDIHAGGADLMFPHHENEIAQSCCADPGTGFARYWLHNGMVRVEGRKMSKSLGNFLTMEDLRAQAPGEVLRLALLSTHYRAPLDWTEKLLEDSRRTLAKWRKLVAGVEASGAASDAVTAALADDLNTPGALTELHALAAAGEAAALKASAQALGLLTDALGDWAIAPQADAGTAARIDALLAARAEARQSKDFARADAIRAALDGAGVVVMDRPGAATEWELSPGFDAAKLAQADA